MNPGDAFGAYTISNRAPSATRTTLRECRGYCTVKLIRRKRNYEKVLKTPWGSGAARALRLFDAMSAMKGDTVNPAVLAVTQSAVSASAAAGQTVAIPIAFEMLAVVVASACLLYTSSPR